MQYIQDLLTVEKSKQTITQQTPSSSRAGDSHPTRRPHHSVDFRDRAAIPPSRALLSLLRFNALALNTNQSSAHSPLSFAHRDV